MSRLKHDSPLELYKKAYNFHYKENKISIATEIYLRLINEFPESDVSGYAVIQLEKIKSTNFVKKNRPAMSILFMILIVISFISTVFIGVVVLNLKADLNQLKENNRLAFLAIAKFSANHKEEALDILKELKITSKDDITPFAISAEVYRKNKDYKNAINEYESFNKLYSGNFISKSEIVILNQEKERYNSKRKNKKSSQISHSSKSVKKKYKKKSKVYPKKKIIQADSISYF